MGSIINRRAGFLGETNNMKILISSDIYIDHNVAKSIDCDVPVLLVDDVENYRIIDTEKATPPKIDTYIHVDVNFWVVAACLCLSVFTAVFVIFR